MFPLPEGVNYCNNEDNPGWGKHTNKASCRACPACRHAGGAGAEWLLPVSSVPVAVGSVPGKRGETSALAAGLGPRADPGQGWLRPGRQREPLGTQGRGKGAMLQASAPAEPRDKVCAAGARGCCKDAGGRGVGAPPRPDRARQHRCPRQLARAVPNPLTSGELAPRNCLQKTEVYFEFIVIWSDRFAQASRGKEG